MQERATTHFEALRQDARDEIKRRIEQRDRYSIQLSIALAALLAVSFSTPGLRAVLIAAPLVSIYFTVLILYSYRVHHVLAKYLREQIEPELARVYGTPVDKEWENYYTKHAVPGIRRQFFLAALWVVSVLSLIYLWFAELDKLGSTVLGVATGVYGLADIMITIFLRGESTRERLAPKA